MEFNYNVTGEHKKTLVTTISEVLGMKAVYKGMLTAAYVIDSLTVTKEGTLIADERTDDTTLNKVLAALAVKALPIEVTDDRISFPWFSKMPEPEDKQAYMALITALCEMANNQKRVTTNDKAPANDKYAFRCFLLRLGFIGDEYKTARKILLHNLTGNTAFRNGRPAKEEQPWE